MSEQDQPSVAAEQGNKDNDAEFKRRSSWQASLAAISYINELGKQPELKIRHSDRITGISVFVATLASVLCLVLNKTSGLSYELLLICDFFLGVSLSIYVCNRLGIFTALPPRQAALTWQLMQAFTFVGVFITINLVILVTLLLTFAPMWLAH